MGGKDTGARKQNTSNTNGGKDEDSKNPQPVSVITPRLSILAYIILLLLKLLTIYKLCVTRLVATPPPLSIQVYQRDFANSVQLHFSAQMI